MRKLSIIAVIAMLTMMLGTAVCFAGELEIIKSYPKDGGTGLQPVNCAVKLYFNMDVSAEEYRVANEKCFRLTDAEGEEKPVKVVHDPNDNTMVLVVVSGDLESDTEYTLTISGEFTAADEITLETDRTITFKTLNQSTNMTISMVMMAVMFIGIIFVSSKQMKRQAAKDAEEKQKNAKVNPYKVSKQTGKSVDEIVRKTEKQKQKRAAEGVKDKPKEKKKERVEGNRKVKGPRPISAAGSTYLSGKKAKAEAAAKKAAAKMAAGTTKPKNKSSKKKKKKK